MLSDALRELGALQHLRAGWDGEGAAVISGRAIAEAHEILTAVISRYPLLDRSLRPHSVTPVPNGGVQIEWRTGEQLVEVEVGPAGQIAFFYADRTGQSPQFLERDSLRREAAVDLVTQIALAPYSA